MFEKTGDRWEDKFEGLPGFGLFIAIVASLLAWWSPAREVAVGHEANPLVAVAVAYLLYRSGSLLDNLLFGKAYGNLEKPSRWPGGRVLHNARINAATQLNCPLTGLYAKAEGILKGSGEWKDQVKPKMDGSKAARSFILPLLVVLVVDLIRHSQVDVPNPLDALSLEPRTVETILVAAVLVYLILDLKVVQWVCLGAAPILLVILFLHFPNELLNSWQFQPLTAAAALMLVTVIYLWRRLDAMISLYRLASELAVFEQFVSVENAATNNEVRGILFAGKSILPLYVVALYPCKEQGITEDHLQRAERLVRSLSLLDVQVYRHLERPRNVRWPGREETLPLSWLSDEYMKKIKGDYKPAGSKPGREAPSDLVIRVVIDSDGKRPRNLEKLANLINSRRRQFELLGTTTLPEAR